MQLLKTKNLKTKNLKKKSLKTKNWVATLKATPRHMSRLLRLLPSGPGRVHRVSLRGDQKGHHRKLKSSELMQLNDNGANYR